MNGKYLVYRIYHKSECSDATDRSRFYGWSTNKNIIKAFRKQRNQKKYKIIKMSENEISKTFSENIDDIDAMIDYIKLRSVKTNEKMTLFLTLNEMRETEKKIQRMFLDQAALSRIPGTGNYLQMFLHLDNYYADALYFIGFRPREVDDLFPSADYHDDYSSIEKIEEEIDAAYEEMYQFPREIVKKSTESAVGLAVIEDVSNKIYYSLESFIKVMKDDM